uniref:Uncharacterized protein n=1 Tax=Phage sp. ctSLR2 TaxID=2825796 RepID=A0A8S5QDR5_9VIRU|nr:MAG TPA: hypothetical protein [Phage sp. ctSLR2]
METINTKDYNNDLEIKDSLNRVKAVDGAGNDILVNPGVVANSGGCGVFLSNIALAYGKWYRIAIGNMAALLMVGNKYYNTSPQSQLFYIFANGYNNIQSVVQLANAGKVINKARILHKLESEGGGDPMLEICVNTIGANQFMFSYSCSMYLAFINPVEVSETPESGYTVKEFVF